MSKNDVWNRDETPPPHSALKPLMSALLLAAFLAGAVMAMGAPERASEPAAVAAWDASGDAGGLRSRDEPCTSSDADAPAHDRFLHWAIAHHRLAVTGAVPP